MGFPIAKPTARNMVNAIRYCEAEPSTQGLSVEGVRLPCRTQRTPERIYVDARTGAVDWNKETGAQVDFVEPET